MPISFASMCRLVAGFVWLATISGLATGLLPTTARAQFSMRDDPATRFEFGGHVEAIFLSQFETKTNGGDKFDSWTIGIAGDFGGPINESILIGIDAAYRYSSYDFKLDGPPGVPPIYGSSELPYDPWNSINTFDIEPNTSILIGNKLSFVTAVPIRFSAETGSGRNAFTAGISTILRWQISDDFRIGVGLGVTSQLEDNAETFPIVSLDWTITDALTLRTEGGWVQGGQAILLWGPNPAIRLSLSAGYERNRFRLDDNGPAADRDGIAEITAVPIEIGLRFGLYENAFFDVRFGLAVGGHLRVETSNGRKLYDESYDPAPRIGLNVTLPFGLPRRTPSN